jgi:hypothetical protein
MIKLAFGIIVMILALLAIAAIVYAASIAPENIGHKYDDRD